MTPKNSSGLDPEAVRIGETLRTIRKIRGFKLAEMANELDISYSYLSNIEAGRKRLTEQLLARAARILDVEQIAIVREGYFEAPVGAAPFRAGRGAA
jgi:transcriptional regulator with XRE-family HTH domain